MSEKEKDTKIESNQAYELGFHLVPTLGDDAVGKAFDKVISLVEKVGGKVVSKSGPVLLNLEYQMEKTIDSVKHKYNTAYFAWVIFEGGDVQELGEEVEVDEDVLRQLLIKTDQKDSMSAEDVATVVNAEEEDEDAPKVEKEEKKEEKKEEVVEESKEEDKKEEKGEEEKTDEKKVDEAIDELVK